MNGGRKTPAPPATTQSRWKTNGVNAEGSSRNGIIAHSPMFQRTLTLTAIAGIPVRIHWSWLIICGLLMATLTAFYQRYTDLVGAGMLALLTSLLIGVSIILHELSHALIARRYAVTVQSITLFALGGAAEVHQDAPTPDSEFAIAAAGPLFSLLLALICGGVSWTVGQSGQPTFMLLVTVMLHLCLTNGIMAVFNLLPGYPMDGGRILQATLWFLTDDMLLSTRIAARIGQVCGLLIGMAGLGLAIIFRQPFLALWLAVIGFFLYRMARTSYYQLFIQTMLTGMQVMHLMQRSHRTVSPELTLEQFVARYVLGQSEQSFVVVGQRSWYLNMTVTDGSDGVTGLIGVITLHNLRRFALGEWASTHVREAMIPLSQVCTIPPDLNLLDALHLMTRLRVDMLPVTEGAHLLGVLRRRDVLVYVQMQRP